MLHLLRLPIIQHMSQQPMLQHQSQRARHLQSLFHYQHCRLAHRQPIPAAGRRRHPQRLPRVFHQENLLSLSLLAPLEVVGCSCCSVLVTCFIVITRHAKSKSHRSMQSSRQPRRRPPNEPTRQRQPSMQPSRQPINQITQPSRQQPLDVHVPPYTVTHKGKPSLTFGAYYCTVFILLYTTHYAQDPLTP